jgi:hypothetical protein
LIAGVTEGAAVGTAGVVVTAVAGIVEVATVVVGIAEGVIAVVGMAAAIVEAVIAVVGDRLSPGLSWSKILQVLRK